MLIKQIRFFYLVCAFGFNSLWAQSLSVGSYNVENLFDPNDNPLTQDEEFTPNGAKKWTEKKLLAKIEKLSKVISDLNQSQAPDVLGLVEVENDRVMELLAKSLKARGHNFPYYHISQGPDKRGINNAVISKFPFCEKDDVEQVIERQVDLSAFPNSRPTRPLLAVSICHPKGTFTMIVNHWPSRIGGVEESEPKRMAAARTLRDLIAEIQNKDPKRAIVSVGDFNDEPENDSIHKTLGADDLNTSADLLGLNFELANFLQSPDTPAARKLRGTYFFKREKKWNSLDQFIVTSSMAKAQNFFYVKNSFGPKPGSWYTNAQGAPVNFEAGGASDHLPITAEFVIK